ncbi:MAG: hypothetical protein IKM18_07350 [Clostridia bacterium]|nr:hypothetical protein [Clostridia bacterium]
MTDAGKKISDGAKHNAEARKQKEKERERERQTKRNALLYALESGDLSASETVQAVKMLNNI